MTIKHKILKDFQYLSEDKKIIILKSGSIIENYVYRTKSDTLILNMDIVNSNGDYFQILDWKAELISYLKQNKIAGPSVLAKKLSPFIEDMFIIGSTKPSVSNDYEGEYRSKLEYLNKREVEMESDYRSKLISINNRELEYEINLNKLESESKKQTGSADLTKIEEMLISYRNDVPWHHNGMDIFRERIDKIIDELRLNQL